MNGNHESNFVIGESKIHIRCDSKEALNTAVTEIKRHRKHLVEYIKRHPRFRYALKPIPLSSEAPRIVKIMAMASSIANVGPMASVAGALADIGLECMRRKGAKIAIVENGGEIAAFTERPIVISIYSNSPVFSSRIGFRLKREDCPIGVATSSSKTDRTLSFGEADSVTVVANNASLADAAATAICNSVIGEDVKASIQRGLEKAKTIEGIRGVLIIREDHSGLWGSLPQIVKIT